jgi:hypothetical protein
VATGIQSAQHDHARRWRAAEGYLAKYGADRVRTVGMTWLGLTVGCAECHDHKFDPFTTKDFYSLKAFFADVRQWGVYSDYKYTPNADLKNWSNDHPFPPEEVVDSPYLSNRAEKLRSQIVMLANGVATRAGDQQRTEFETWISSTQSLLAQHPDGWLAPQPIVMALTNITVVTNRTKVTNVVAATEATPALTNLTNVVSFKTNTTLSTNFIVEPNGSLLFGSRPDLNPIPMRLSAGSIAAIRFELIPHAKHSNSVFRGNRTAASLQLSATLKRRGETNETKLAFYHADADHKEPRYANGFEIVGVKDQWKVSREHAKEKQTGVWLLDPPLRVSAGDTLSLTVKTNGIGCLRVSVSPFAMVNPLDRFQLPNSKSEINRAWLASTGADTNAFAEYKKLQRELIECRDGKSPTVVTASWKPDTTRILPRGNWQSEDGEIVEPLPPHFLPQAERAGTNRLTRLDLAKWIVSPENPLTARTGRESFVETILRHGAGESSR